MKKISLLTLFTLSGAFALVTSCEQKSDMEKTIDEVGDAAEEVVEEVKE